MNKALKYAAGCVAAFVIGAFAAGCLVASAALVWIVCH